MPNYQCHIHTVPSFNSQTRHSPKNVKFIIDLSFRYDNHSLKNAPFCPHNTDIYYCNNLYSL